MSGRDAGRGSGADPLAAVRGLLSGDDPNGAGGTFVRGLTVGALIGAAVAGSAIWQRRRGARGGSAGSGVPGLGGSAAGRDAGSGRA